MPGVHAENFLVVVGAALIFGLLNALVRPLLLFLTCPLMIVTLGLFTLVINAAMFLLTAWISGFLGLGFYVDGLWPAFLGALVVTVVSIVLTLLLRDEEAERRRRERRKH